MEDQRADVPSEYIDLSTEAFKSAFPELAEREGETQESRRARRSRPRGPDEDDKDEKG